MRSTRLAPLRAFAPPIAALLLVLAPTRVVAAPPLSDDIRPSGRTCFINERAAGLRTASGPGGVAMGAPVPASPAVLVLRVDFADEPMVSTLPDAEAFFERVRAYFVENSYDAFRPTFTVTSDVHRLGALAAYGADCGGDIACNDPQLRAAAIAAENAAGRDFSAFDQVMIFHAGAGQETSGAGNDIWSVFYPGGYIVDGKSFFGFTVVPEREASGIEALGVAVHEYGHQIGLPDLYDTGVVGGASTVGSWDVMDFPYTAAPDGPRGGNPPHLGAWSKSFLGFLTPAAWSGVGTASLPSANVSSAAVRIPIGSADDPSTEYLLVEYRHAASTSTFDKGLPGGGLLVWHVDDAIASDPTRLANNDVNTPSVSGRGHRGVELLEADFTEIYAGALRAGQPGDAYGNGGRVLPPATDAFRGVASGIALTSVAGVGTVQASVFIEPPPVSLTTFTGAALALDVGDPGAVLRAGLAAGALPVPSQVFAASYTATTLLALGGASAAASLTPTGVGFVLAAENNRAPSGGVSAEFNFGAVAPFNGMNEADLARLVLARFVPERDLWVPVSTAVDAAAHSVRAALDRLSIVQVMSAAPGAAPAEVLVFPNPLRPSLGASYRVMNFSNVPPEARVRLFTSAGEFIRELRASAAGQAAWDGRNESGADAASGLYLAVIEDAGGGRRAVKRVAIER